MAWYHEHFSQPDHEPLLERASPAPPVETRLARQALDGYGRISAHEAFAADLEDESGHWVTADADKTPADKAQRALDILEQLKYKEVEYVNERFVDAFLASFSAWRRKVGYNNGQQVLAGPMPLKGIKVTEGSLLKQYFKEGAIKKVGEEIEIRKQRLSVSDLEAVLAIEEQDVMPRQFTSRTAGEPNAVKTTKKNKVPEQPSRPRERYGYIREELKKRPLDDEALAFIDSIRPQVLRAVINLRGPRLEVAKKLGLKPASLGLYIGAARRAGGFKSDEELVSFLQQKGLMQQEDAKRSPHP